MIVMVVVTDDNDGDGESVLVEHSVFHVFGMRLGQSQD